MVVSAVTADPLTALGTLLEQLAQRCRVAVAGAGAHDFVAPGVLALTGDPVAEADRLSAIVAS